MKASAKLRADDVRLFLSDGGERLLALPGLPVLDVIEIMRVGTHNGEDEDWQGVRDVLAPIFDRCPFDVVFADAAGLLAVFRQTPSAKDAKKWSKAILDAGWVRQARADRSQGKTGFTSDERAELAALRKALRVVTMERDILGKSRGLLREGERMRFAFIQTEKISTRQRGRLLANRSRRPRGLGPLGLAGRRRRRCGFLRRGRRRIELLLQLRLGRQQIASQLRLAGVAALGLVAVQPALEQRILVRQVGDRLFQRRDLHPHADELRLERPDYRRQCIIRHRVQPRIRRRTRHVSPIRDGDRGAQAPRAASISDCVAAPPAA